MYAYPNEDGEVEPFTWDKQYLKQLQHVNIPVYVPSYIVTGRTTPEQLVKVLRSMVKLDT